MFDLKDLSLVFSKINLSPALLISSSCFLFSMTLSAHANQPDYGYHVPWTGGCRDDGFECKQTMYIPGVADDLNKKEREIYNSVKKDSNKHLFKKSRKSLVSLLKHLRQHPNTVCEDSFNTDSYKLVCTYKNNQGREQSTDYAWLMTTDLKSHLDKNMLTPAEKIARDYPSSGSSYSANTNRTPQSASFSGSYGNYMSHHMNHSGYHPARADSRAIFVRYNPNAQNNAANDQATHQNTGQAAIYVEAENSKPEPSSRPSTDTSENSNNSDLSGVCAVGYGGPCN